MTQIGQIDATTLRYARGWLLTRDHAHDDVPQHWLHRSLPNGWSLWSDRNLSVAMVDGDRWLALIGHAVDLDAGTADTLEVATHLAAALRRGRDEFLTAIDRLAGRHAIVHGDATGTHVLNDATGMRAVHFAPGANVVGSHAKLVAHHSRRTEPSPASLPGTRELLKYGWPGRSTAWTGVQLLTPNTELDVTTGEVRRFHPRVGPTQLSVEHARRVVMHDLQRHGKALVGRQPISVSLTAGLDSRATLAALLSMTQDVEFFTYHTGPAHDADVEVATTIAGRLGLRHEVLTVTDRSTDDALQFRELLRDNSQYVHHPGLADTYRHRFGEPNRLHIRSNLGEIGRRFYQPANDRPRPCTPVSLAAAYAGGREALATNPDVLDAFAEYADHSNLADGHGYDPYDLLYWEHRMGAWHASVVMESDPAFDTTVLWNSRRTLSTLLGVNRADRMSGAVFRGIVAEHLPELADVAINPQRTASMSGL